jgi:hypothetical protein
MKTVMKKIFFLCGSPLGNNCNEEESGNQRIMMNKEMMVS